MNLEPSLWPHHFCKSSVHMHRTHLDIIRSIGQGWAFCDFGKLVFAITSRKLRILTEHIEIKNSLDSKPQFFSICSVRILNNLEVIEITSFSKVAKCSTLSMGTGSNHARIDDYNPIDSLGQSHIDRGNGSNHVDMYQYTQTQGLYHWTKKVKCQD